ncbi:MAG: type II toxin-antitoxin system RelE/ParE family toxin [Rhodospirillales bacterium]
MQLVWSEPALRDLAAARAYITLDNPGAAVRQIELVLQAAETLVRFPNIGRPGRRPGTRELVVGRTPYRLPYRITAERIEILRVLHGRQRWPEHFD